MNVQYHQPRAVKCTYFVVVVPTTISLLNIVGKNAGIRSNMQIVESADSRDRSSRVQVQKYGAAEQPAPAPTAPAAPAATATAHAAATQATATQKPTAPKPATTTTAVQQHAGPRAVVFATEQ